MVAARQQEKILSVAGQSTLETTVLIVVAVVALVLMQTYLKRGIQGHLRSGVDSIGGQYDPERTTGDTYSNHVSNITTLSVGEEQDIPTGDSYGTTQKRTVSITETQIHYDNTTSSSSEYVAAP